MKVKGKSLVNLVTHVPQGLVVIFPYRILINRAFTDFDTWCDLDLDPLFTQIKSARVVIGIYNHKKFKMVP